MINESDCIVVTLDELVTDLGIDGAVDFAEFLLPRLAERQNTLHTLLCQGDWEAASRYAHKTLSSAYFFERSLAQMLRKIEEKVLDEISKEEFRQQLYGNFKSSIQETREWLQIHGSGS